MTAIKKKVALFGGSFNPPHEGHLEIVRRVARRKIIDEVWILPTWRHPFKKKLPSFKKRTDLCLRFFCIEKVKVKTYEKRPGSTGYTIDLVDFLQKKFPGDKFYWVMGSDTYRQRRRWRQFSELKKRVRLIIFPRGPKSMIPNI